MTRRRGFILLLALAMLALVGVAILTLGAACAYDGRRTMDRSQRAQLDQLLLAGATEAAEHVKTTTPTVDEWWETDLPPSLSEQHASLVTTVDSIDADQITLNIRAILQDHTAQQTLHFRHATDGWQLSGAQVPL